MNKINLARIDLNLLVTFEALMDLRSVTLAAERLGRTPSAISHALARLREQVGDPLMVKVGGKMQPSPFALRLIEDIKPLLRGIERVISPPDAFDPAISQRGFRLAIPGFPTLVSTVSQRVLAEAPHVDLEWLPVSPLSNAALVEERIDLAMLSPGVSPPGGTEAWFSPPTRRLVFARGDHPAVSDWGMEAWLAYPHVVVDIGGAGRQTVQDAVERDGLQRRIGARVAEFAGLAPLISRTDNLGTFAPIGIAEDAQAFGLAVLEPPIDMAPVSFGIAWNARLANDPAIRWIREIVIAAYEETDRRVNAIVSAADIVRPKAAGRA
jgi:DNA-binding transcriptional LysR family regulator